MDDLDDRDDMATDPGERFEHTTYSAPEGDVDELEQARLVAELHEQQRPRVLMARFNACTRARQAREQVWIKSIRSMHLQFSEESEDSWESDRFMPLVFKHVNTALPSIVAATLPPTDLWHLKGADPRGRENARSMKRLVNHHRQAYDYDEAYEGAYWWSAVVGTGYAEHGWRMVKEQRYVVRMVEDESAAFGKRKEVTQEEVVVEDRPFVESLNPFDVWPSPGGRVGSDDPYYFIACRTTIGDLRALAGQGHIEPQALEAWIKDEVQGKSTRGMERFGVEIGEEYDDLLQDVGYHEDESEEVSPEDVLSDEWPITVLKYVSRKEIVTLGGPDRIIGFSPNENVHGKTGIVCMHFFMVPDSPWGMSLAEVIQSHQELANENINRFMDTAAIEAMAPIVVDRARCNLTDDELVMQPNAIIRARGADAVQRMQLPAPTNLAMLLDQHLARDADDLTGFTEQARGLAAQDSQTATAFNGTQSNLKTRLVMHVKQSGRFLKRSGELLVALMQQFYTMAQVVEFSGEDGLEYAEITPEQTLGKMHVAVMLNASRASPDVRAQRALQMFQVTIPLLQTGALQNPMVRGFLRMVMEANEMDEIDSILPRQKQGAKDPRIENVWLDGLMDVQVLPQEDHNAHLMAHQEALNVILEEADPTSLNPDPRVEAFTKHILEHQQMVAQMAAQQAAPQGAAPGQGTPMQQAQGASGAGINPGAGSSQQPAALAGAQTGGQGTPGVAAPGPSAPGQQR